MQKAEAKLARSNSTDEAKHLPNQGIFSVKGRERDIWEHENPFILGKVRRCEVRSAVQRRKPRITSSVENSEN